MALYGGLVGALLACGFTIGAAPSAWAAEQNNSIVLPDIAQPTKSASGSAALSELHYELNPEIEQNIGQEVQSSTEPAGLAAAQALPDTEVSSPYSLRTFGRQAGSVPLEIGGLFGGITFLGVTNWSWGNSKFRFKSEGWFDRDSASLGMDKLGHAYSTYVMTEFLTASINREASDKRGADFTAGLIAMGLMTYVEVFDGFSSDHGFSKEDMVADALGTGFSILRSQVPVLKRTLDFRLEYLPSKNVTGFHPITDYSGQRYILAFQPAGLIKNERNPLRFVEILGGYYARGFTTQEAERGEPRRRELFVGIGLNLQSLLFPTPTRWWERTTNSVLDYVQVPYTAVYSK